MNLVVERVVSVTFVERVVGIVSGVVGFVDLN